MGIDLNPGPANRWVLYGDFHTLQFPSHTVDVVFTNSLDHALDLPAILRDVRRVLRPPGLFLVEAGEGGPGLFESLSWTTVKDLVAFIATSGFEVLNHWPFEYPWAGEQIAFRVRS